MLKFVAAAVVVATFVVDLCTDVLVAAFNLRLIGPTWEMYIM